MPFLKDRFTGLKKQRKNKRKIIMALKQLTGQNGPVQKTLHGGERIYSRRDTAELIFLAQNAKTFQDWVRLGRFLHRATMAQQKRKPEYRMI